MNLPAADRPGTPGPGIRRRAGPIPSPGCRHGQTGGIGTLLGLLVAALLIGANGAFVAAEFALVAVDRAALEARASGGSATARVAMGLLRRLSYHLSGAQLGITVTSLVLGFVAEPTVAAALDPVLPHGWSIVVALGLATGFQMVLGELVPKNLAIARPLPTLLVLAPVVRVYGLVGSPLIRGLNGLANVVVRAMGVEPREELASVHTPEELELVVRSSGEEGTLRPDIAELARRTLRFASKTAADVLVPRVDVTWIRADAPVSDLVRLAVTTGYSRFPVCGTDLDDVVGVVHVKDIQRVPPEERANTPVSAIASAVVAVPESRDLESLLFELRSAPSHLAIVVDEYGGTAGIVTLEDLVEEIVGHIEDEHDRVPVGGGDRFTILEPTAGAVVVEGTTHLDDLEDLVGLRLPEGPYETVAGFILARLGRIPSVGDEVAEAGWRLRVVDMDRLRIARVEVVPPADEPGEPG